MNSKLNSGLDVNQADIGNIERKRAVKNKVVVTHIDCKSCSGSEVTRSRTKGIDKIVNLILPTATFRCLGCYDRFWSIDTLFGNKLRLLLWLTALIAFVLMKTNFIDYLGIV